MRLKPQRDDFTVVAAQGGGKPPFTLKTHTSDPAKACLDAATIQPKLTVKRKLDSADGMASVCQVSTATLGWS